MPRKCGLCKKEGHNRKKCDNLYYKGDYNCNYERDGKGTYEYKLRKYRGTHLFGAKYEGCWVNGKREGWGEIAFVNGDKYEGEWKNDKQHGKGIMYYLNGFKNDGEWKMGEFVGEKELLDGSKYKGSFNSRGYIESGTITLPNGNILKGFESYNDYKYLSEDDPWEIVTKEKIYALLSKKNRSLYNGILFNGVYGYLEGGRRIYCTASDATLIYPNGDKFEGVVSVECIAFNMVGETKIYPLIIEKITKDGEGTITYKNGKTFSGVWGENHGNYGGEGELQEGEGYMEITEDEGKYYGNINVNIYNGGKTKCGLGKMIYNNGNIYNGFWKDNRRKQGCMTYANGDKYDGVWDEGVYSGQGVMTCANGDKYNGNWLYGEYSGQGVMTYTNGDKYDGMWKEGKYSGQGIMTYANGDKYDGAWEEGKYNGNGKFTKKNGDSFYGMWKNGMKNNLFVAHNKNKLIGVYKYTDDVITVELE